MTEKYGYTKRKVYLTQGPYIWAGTSVKVSFILLIVAVSRVYPRYAEDRNEKQDKAAAGRKRVNPGAVRRDGRDFQAGH